MELFWFKSGSNFGDCLTPYILRAYGLTVKYSALNSSKIMGIGSTLELASKMPDKRGVLWSTGAMYGYSKFNLENYKVIGLRGKLTKNACQGASHAIIGDGGLICKEAFLKLGNKLPTVKKFKLGIIPHYVDRDYVLKSVPLVHLTEVKVINITSPINQIIHEAAECECIVSSSLHGLILADSLEIPNRRFYCPTSGKILGEGFKYSDYYSAFDMIPQPTLSLNVSSNDINSVIGACNASYIRKGLNSIKTNIIQSIPRIESLYRTMANSNRAIVKSRKVVIRKTPLKAKRRAVKRVAPKPKRNVVKKMLRRRVKIK